MAKLNLPWQVASRGVKVVLGVLWGIRFFALVAQSLAVPVLRVGVLTLYIAPLMGVPAGQAGMPLFGPYVRMSVWCRSLLCMSVAYRCCMPIAAHLALVLVVVVGTITLVGGGPSVSFQTRP